METVQQLVRLVDAELAAIALIFFRVSGVVALAPALGERMLPIRVRIAVIVALTILVYPIVARHYPVPPGSGTHIVWSLASELMLGLMTGIGLRLLVFSLQIAGSIAAQATSLSQLFGNAAADPQPAIGHLLLLAGLAVATSFGLHVQIVKFLALSYTIFPPDVAPGPSDVAAWGTRNIADAFALGMSVAMPFVVAGLLYNVALGAINRAMPQLMVSFVGAPAIAMAGLVLMFLLAPLMISVWKDAVLAFLLDPYGSL